VLAKPYGVSKIDAAPTLININFRKDPPIDPMRVIELVQKNRNIKLVGNEKLRVEKVLSNPQDRAQAVREVLRLLGKPIQQN
jgi:transcription-repair coupling factor (superfamily II helicase)